MSFTNTLEGLLANEVLGGVGYTPPATVYASLHSAWPTEGAVGAELSGNNYSRVAVTNNTTNWPNYGSDQKASNIAINFPTASGNWLEAVAFALWDDPTAGNMLMRAWLGPDPPRIFTATTADVFTAPGHGLSVDDRVAVLATPGATLPTGVSEGTLYWVKTVSGDTVTLSTTQGGATLDITVAGSGFLKRVVPKTVASGEMLSFPGGNVILTLD
jgi:hypothetical protein